LIIIVFNNGGGQIFNYLEGVKELSESEELFMMPHSLDYALVAKNFGLDYFSFNEDLGEVQDFSGVGSWALRKEGLSEGEAEAEEGQEARGSHEGAWWMQALRR
jgi:2-succinyl-5-enolpyruvyl-6-hydroxy-3-cyclohexene-1-carboxylate synthase